MLFSIKYVHRLKWNGLYQSLMWSCFGIMFMLLYPVSRVSAGQLSGGVDADKSGGGV